MSASASLYQQGYGDFMLPTLGVALVRNPVPGNVAVPTSGSIGLLALGLLALGVRRHVVGR